jgi:hypothetical protein
VASLIAVVGGTVSAGAASAADAASPPCPPSYVIDALFKGPNCGIYGNALPVPWAINDLGQVVGHYFPCSFGPATGFRQEPNGTFVTLPTPAGYSDNRPIGINNGGQIAGTVVSPIPPRGYRRTGSVYALIEPPEGWWGTEATAINQAGVVCGGAIPDPQTNHYQAFIWDGKITEIIKPLVGPRSFATDINDQEVVVGWMGEHFVNDAFPFIHDGERTILLPLPEGALSAEATSVNNLGDVLVRARMTDELPHIHRPYLWRNGQYTTLPWIEGYGRVFPEDINDAGVAVGYCDNNEPGLPPITALAWHDSGVVAIAPPGSGGPPLGWALAYAVNEGMVAVGYGHVLGSSAHALIASAVVPSGPDMTRDGMVDGTDLALLIAAWATDNPDADLDCDGTVDGFDLGILLANWGTAR